MSNKKSGASIENIYNLDGRVPILKAIPFGLQHVLAMFVANLTPIIIIASIARFPFKEAGSSNATEIAMLLQSAMFVAGIGTLIQLYPIWKIGAKLPIVMGISFSFVASLSFIVTNYDYRYMVGAVIVGGIVEGILGLFYKYWKKLISPIVSACVVTTIGFSLLPVGGRSFGGGYIEDFASLKYILLGSITLLACLIFSSLVKGFLKPLSILFGLVVGYIAALFMNLVNFNDFNETIKVMGYISLPKVLPFKPVFHLGSIISILVIFLVSAAETIGDASAVVANGLDREITDKEISGAIACDGFASFIAGIFALAPLTSFSQNVGLVTMTKVVNRFTIMFGALILILAGLFPPIGAFFSTLPQPVIGGCTIMLFGGIVVSGIAMIGKCGFDNRNTIIVALSISAGLGLTQIPEIFNYAPDFIRDIFAGNPVASVFIIATILNLALPKNMEIKS